MSVCLHLKAQIFKKDADPYPKDPQLSPQVRIRTWIRTWRLNIKNVHGIGSVQDVAITVDSPRCYNHRCQSKMLQSPLPVQNVAITIASQRCCNHRCQSKMLQSPLPVQDVEISVASPRCCHLCCQSKMLHSPLQVQDIAISVARSQQVFMSNLKGKINHCCQVFVSFPAPKLQKYYAF